MPTKTILTSELPTFIAMASTRSACFVAGSSNPVSINRVTTTRYTRCLSPRYHGQQIQRRHHQPVLFRVPTRLVKTNTVPIAKAVITTTEDNTPQRHLGIEQGPRPIGLEATGTVFNFTDDNDKDGSTETKDDDDDDDDDDKDDPSLTETFRVNKNEDGGRIDKVIAERYGERSRTYVQKLLSDGCVRVNDTEKTNKSFRVSRNDVITVKFLQQQKDLQLQAEDIPLDVLYEDAEIAIINKPAGMVVHPSPGHWTGTLVHALCHRYPQMMESSSSSSLPKGEPERPGIVHRLDKGTSGVIVVARTTRAHMKLSERFAQREIRKEYIAITVGDPCGKTGRQMLTIDVPIGRNSHDRTKMTVDTSASASSASSSFLSMPARSCINAKEARTSVHTLSHDANGLLHAARVELHTGRTHQIRVHFEHVNSPVLGDDLYGKLDINRRFISSAQRPMLHAHLLEFAHPIYEDRLIRVKAPLPADMRQLLRNVVYPTYQEDFPDW